MEAMRAIVQLHDKQKKTNKYNINFPRDFASICGSDLQQCMTQYGAQIIFLRLMDREIKLETAEMARYQRLVEAIIKAGGDYDYFDYSIFGRNKEYKAKTLAAIKKNYFQGIAGGEATTVKTSGIGLLHEEIKEGIFLIGHVEKGNWKEDVVNLKKFFNEKTTWLIGYEIFFKDNSYAIRYADQKNLQRLQKVWLQAHSRLKTFKIPLILSKI